MPKAQGTIRVQPIPGEVLRYRVESWSTPQHPHICDLSLYAGNGECDCKDFHTRRVPAIKDGKPLFSAATTCRHLRAARRYFLVETLGEMARRLHAPPASR